MRVVDTSAWIEYLSTTSPAGRAVAGELPSPEEWIVPTIVQLELMKFFGRTDEQAAEELFAVSQQYVVIPLDADLAIAAAATARRHKLATADAIVYATAQHYGADLLTCDAHFKELDGVRYVPKSAAAGKRDEAGP